MQVATGSDTKCNELWLKCMRPESSRHYSWHVGSLCVGLVKEGQAFIRAGSEEVPRALTLFDSQDNLLTMLYPLYPTLSMCSACPPMLPG
eukprot:1160088-Pelagomonas_calceolata.AAC.1